MLKRPIEPQFKVRFNLSTSAHLLVCPQTDLRTRTYWTSHSGRIDGPENLKIIVGHKCPNQSRLWLDFSLLESSNAQPL